MITTEQKKEIIEKYGRCEGDTGSPEVQVALLTARINDLNEHFKMHPKDVSDTIAQEKHAALFKPSEFSQHNGSAEQSVARCNAERIIFPISLG